MQKSRLLLLNVLRNFKPYDEKEASDIKKIVELVKKYENIFSRESGMAHVTGSALVVNPRTKRFLLHEHKRLKKWLQFGGHADGETNLPDVAMKEAKEETGLSDLKFATNKSIPVDIELQTITETKEGVEHFHLDFRYILFTEAIKVPSPNESESQILRFFSFKEINGLDVKLDPSLRRLAKKAENLLASISNN